ncbi:cation:proton antiporter [Photobacterium minamisatsumaniensis]|uniref:cation:proton antiporter n=1 Tax=Photobacterium minamisatsumaniensis TaxID=2910233 RepID=UPI003D0ED780
MYYNLAVLALFAFLFSAVAGRIERSIISGPMIFIGFGLISGPMILGVLNIKVDAVQLRIIADLALALVLFIDAANADLSLLRKFSHIPSRMLLIGLPLTITLGVIIGWLFFPQIPLFELCILSTMLAATDAALGKGVVNNKAVPARLREGLNAESGLNDGLCVPVLFLFIALAVNSQTEGTTLALTLFVKEIGIGALVGLILTGVGAAIMQFCYSRGWFTHIWLQIPVIALAFSCFAVAQTLHGSGYIAAFAGGLLFGRLAKKDTHELVLASEGIAELIVMLTWVTFGVAVVGQVWLGISLNVLLYSLLSLTVIRIIPIIISLHGTDESWEHKLFLGWFGPRGLASIVFLLIAISNPLQSKSILIDVVVCTVTLCVITHGISANLWAKRLAQRSQGNNI